MTILDFLFGLTVTPANAYVFHTLGIGFSFERLWLRGSGLCISISTLYAVLHMYVDWPIAIGNAISFVAAVIYYLWKRRKKMMKAVNALGNKAKAVRDKMIRNMPRVRIPALRPIPQAA